MSLDKYFKASALAAQRAIVDSSPLPIPHNSNGQQREFILSLTRPSCRVDRAVVAKNG